MNFDREKHRLKEKSKAQILRKTRRWQELLQKGVCHYCQKYFPPEELTMDHVIPVSLGGHSDWNNVVVCCKNCNNLKKGMDPVAWVKFKKTLL